MAQDYSREQIYNAMRKADAAGDGDAVRALASALRGGASKQEILDIAGERNLSVDEAALDANIASRDAGGDVNTFLPPPKSNMEHLKDATQSAIAGAAQGVAGLVDFPLNIATGVERGINYALGKGGGALLDLLGMEDTAESWRKGAERRDTDMANRKGLADIIEDASPTPEGMEASRFGAQLLGGMAVPLGPKAPKAPIRAPKPAAPKDAARKVVEAGDEHGVRVMTSDVKSPKSFITKTIQAAGERIPIAGTGGPRAAQQRERVEAVKNLAEEFGVEGVGNYIEDVASDLAKTRGAQLASLKGQKDAVINGVQGTVELPRTLQAIDNQIAELTARDTPAALEVARSLAQWRSALSQGKSLPQIEAFRADELSQAFKGGNTLADIKTVGEKALRSIYDPLREDMGVFISRNGTPEQYRAWVKSNDELAAMAGELSTGSFKRVLKDAEATPEAVSRLLFSQKPSDVQRLFGNLSANGKAKARAAVIQRALEKGGREGLEGIDFSPDKFANEIDRLGSTVGVVFDDMSRAQVRGLARVLQATKRASVASAAPPTGVQSTPIVGGYAAGSMFGSGAIPILGGAGILARVYESPAIRNLLIGLSKTKPGSPAESKMMERIGKMIISQGEIQTGRAANTNFSVGVAAGDEQEDQRYN